MYNLFGNINTQTPWRYLQLFYKTFTSLTPIPNLQSFKTLTPAIVGRITISDICQVKVDFDILFKVKSIKICSCISAAQNPSINCLLSRYNKILVFHILFHFGKRVVNLVWGGIWGNMNHPLFLLNTKGTHKECYLIRCKSFSW